jgi:hypothetical protein
MFRSRARRQTSVVAVILLVLGAIVWQSATMPTTAQVSPTVGLRFETATGTIDASGEAVTLATGGLASLLVQTLDSYTGVWEVQCSADGGTTYDADDEVLLTLVGGTSTASEVTDLVGVWQANIAGCTSVRVISTAWTGGDVTVKMQGISSGGSGGGGGAGGASDTELPAAAALADATANPTVPGVGAFMHAWNGSTWDRVQTTRDPCDGSAKTVIPVDIVTATTTELTASLAGASTHYYICSVALVTAGANNVAIVDDDTDNCASVTSGVMGGFGSAAEGFNLAANGGLTLGNGSGTVAKTNGANRVLCIMTSAAVQLSGAITVVAAS